MEYKALAVALSAMLLALFAPGPAFTLQAEAAVAAKIASLACNRCGQPIVGLYYQKSGQAYHQQCYEEQFLPKCALCGAPIKGKYYLDSVENRFHSEHRQAAKSCSTCGRVISPWTSNGGKQTGKKVWTCQICLDSQVNDEATAQSIADGVKAKMESWGFVFNWGKIPVHLGTRQWISANWRKGGHIPEYAKRLEPAGFCRSSTANIRGRRQVQNVEVFAMSGLTKAAFAGLMGHELTHAWFELRTEHRGTGPLKEGTANCVKAIVLGGFQEPEAKNELAYLETLRDPNYGVGYRRARKVVKALGWGALIDSFNGTGDFPVGY